MYRTGGPGGGVRRVRSWRLADRSELVVGLTPRSAELALGGSFRARRGGRPLKARVAQSWSRSCRLTARFAGPGLELGAGPGVWPGRLKARIGASGSQIVAGLGPESADAVSGLELVAELLFEGPDGRLVALVEGPLPNPL